MNVRCLLSLAASATLLAASAGTAQETPISFSRNSTDAEGEVHAVPVTAPSRRRIDRESFLADLAARSVELPDPSGGVDLDRPVLRSEDRTVAAKERIFEHADGEAPWSIVDLIVELEPIPLEPGVELRNLSPERYRETLDRRSDRIVAAQKSYREHVARYGEVIGDKFVTNAMHIRVQAQDVRHVLAHADVRVAHAGWHRVVPTYDGKQLRQATLLDSFANAGITGETGGRFTASLGGDNIKIAIVEGINPVNSFHPGWLDRPGDPSRIVSNMRCVAGSPCAPAAPSHAASHGTLVSWVAAGSIEEGQSSSYTTTDSRLRRSGVASEAVIFYYSVIVGADIFNALINAIFAGVDTVNMSFRILNCERQCIANFECGGLNGLLRFAAAAGTLVVHSAGNQHIPSEPNGCTVGYPGTRPEVMSVGSVATFGSTDYDAANLSDSSSRGLMSVGMGGSLSQYIPTGKIPVVSMAAPGVFTLYFDAWGSFGAVEMGGTSFSTPVVTAAAGLLRQALGLSNSSAQRLKAVTLAMGDGTGARWTGTGFEAGVSSAWGTGKLKVHRLNALPGPAQYLMVEDEVEEGYELVRAFPAGALPSGVTQWKWVADLNVSDLDNVPWVIAEVRDACNGGVVLAGDYQYATVKYLSLTAPLIQPGVCLEMRLYGASVPVGGVEVHSVAYYSAGDPNDH